MFDKKSPFYDTIHHLCSTWTSESGHELEANVVDRIYRFQFRKCMARIMKEWGRVKEETEVLDMSVVTEKTYRGPQIRYSIIGKSDIATYCKFNKVPASIEFSQFKHRLGYCDASDYGFKVKLSKENMERVSANVNSEIYDSLKLYRLKKRYSVLAGDTGFRVDFTIVKTSRAKNLAAAQLHQEPEKYEIEVEYIGSDQPDATKFIGVVEFVLCCLRDDVHITSVPEKERVLEVYFSMVGSGGRRYFIGPKPVTLEHKHLLPQGAANIMTDYSVTEKADGDRALLLFDANGKAFLINNRFNVKGTNITSSKYKSCILDVEVVVRPNGSRLILAFDCYWCNDTPIWTKDLVHRLDMAKQVIQGSSVSKSKYELRAKEFYMDTNIFASVKRILSKIARAEFDYVTDGLIFTPIKFAVGESFEKGPTLGDTWLNVLKWKEPRDNTIDVLVERAQDDAAPSMGSFKIFVGSVRASVETYFEFAVSGNKTSTNFVKYRFVPRGAPDTMDVQLDGAGVAKCANGEEIMDKYIVEVSFDTETNMWKPLRIRHDKIEEARKTGNITANALNPTATSVWRTISNPVTFKQITGSDPVSAENMVPDDMDEDSEYYKSHNVDRKKEIYAMREFHNYWVKGVSLLNRFTDHATKVFDVSCGQGGDMNRWFKCKFTTVVGVDKAEGGIINEDGAYQRLIKKTEIRPPDYKYVFIPMDSGKPWKPQIDGIKDEYLKKVARVTWGLDPSPLQSIKHLEGLVTPDPSFDLVSCQFSLHYFFETEAMLDTLIANINTVLAPGKHFIGTCFDGEKVVSLLGNSEERKGRNDIWKIRRAWTGTYKKTFGQAIDVYVESIDKWHREYLVPYDLLVKRLAKSGIRPLTVSESTALGFGGVSMGSFESLYENMRNSGDTSAHVKNALKMDNNVDERTFSFLNMWFVFVKDYKKAKRSAANATAP